MSIAVLEQLKRQGSKVAATTHFNEIKTFASRTEGCQNGRMAFNPDTLQPLYRLEIGEAGDSHAFAIARRFGLPEAVMARAEELLKPKGLGASSYIEMPEDRSTTAEQAFLAGGAASSASKKEEIGGEVSNEGGGGKGNGASAGNRPRDRFAKGDVVWIYPLKRSGVVYREADERGELIVQVQGEKLKFNHKRLKPYIAKEKLYPGETYDLDIVFESKENRKTRHLMSRKHVEGVEIVLKPEDML